MQTVRLIREVIEPSGRGPGNGQYALQRALREAGPNWLKIGGELQPGEIPLVWCWLDKAVAIQAEIERRPYILGPNVLFESSRRPFGSHGERFLCEGEHCRLIVTESDWYADLIRQCLAPRSFTPVVPIPYPIDPWPGRPLPAEYDLLVYAKSGYQPRDIKLLRSTWHNSNTINYGRYNRQDLIEAARRSRCCVYLSDDDRGPLALAEILLCGCPAVGIECGAPWIVDGLTGYRVASLAADFYPAILAALSLNRAQVRARAAENFDPRIVAAAWIEAITRSF